MKMNYRRYGDANAPTLFLPTAITSQPTPVRERSHLLFHSIEGHQMQLPEPARFQPGVLGFGGWKCGWPSARSGGEIVLEYDFRTCPRIAFCCFCFAAAGLRKRNSLQSHRRQRHRISMVTWDSRSRQLWETRLPLTGFAGASTHIQWSAQR